jgi:alkanesulfonate monooxygenase SsuD/methylene tetrahydromethanopterin reductase-like flavin-dependent oxidoreductase (luciferase family)
MIDLRIGITLPSFVEDPDIAVRVAVAAESAELDAVFAYEHLFRAGRDGETRRPALDCWSLLGAVAAETRTIGVGSLTARASLRPPEVLAHACQTVDRVSGGRMLAVIGAGDRESRVENEEFGVAFGDLDERLAELGDALDAARRAGVRTWVGGTHRKLLALAERADGWNRWAGTPEQFARDAEVVRDVNPRAARTWGGLFVLGVTDELARAKAERLGASSEVITGSPATAASRVHPYLDAGATWVIVAPVDSSEAANAELAAELRASLMA